MASVSIQSNPFTYSFTHYNTNNDTYVHLWIIERQYPVDIATATDLDVIMSDAIKACTQFFFTTNSSITSNKVKLTDATKNLLGAVTTNYPITNNGCADMRLMTKTYSSIRDWYVGDDEWDMYLEDTQKENSPLLEQIYLTNKTKDEILSLLGGSVGNYLKSYLAYNSYGDKILKLERYYQDSSTFYTLYKSDTMEFTFNSEDQWTVQLPDTIWNQLISNSSQTGTNIDWEYWANYFNKTTKGVDGGNVLVCQSTVDTNYRFYGAIYKANKANSTIGESGNNVSIFSNVYINFKLLFVCNDTNFNNFNNSGERNFVGYGTISPSVYNTKGRHFAYKNNNGTYTHFLELLADNQNTSPAIFASLPYTSSSVSTPTGGTAILSNDNMVMARRLDALNDSAISDGMIAETINGVSSVTIAKNAFDAFLQDQSSGYVNWSLKSYTSNATSGIEVLNSHYITIGQNSSGTSLPTAVSGFNLDYLSGRGTESVVKALKTNALLHGDANVPVDFADEYPSSYSSFYTYDPQTLFSSYLSYSTPRRLLNIACNTSSYLSRYSTNTYIKIIYTSNIATVPYHLLATIYYTTH